jgi:hypothetical protein
VTTKDSLAFTQVVAERQLQESCRNVLEMAIDEAMVLGGRVEEEVKAEEDGEEEQLSEIRAKMDRSYYLIWAYLARLPGVVGRVAQAVELDLWKRRRPQQPEEMAAMVTEKERELLRRAAEDGRQVVLMNRSDTMVARGLVAKGLGKSILFFEINDAGRAKIAGG